MTRYAHNSKLLVSAGQWVEQGPVSYTHLDVYKRQPKNAAYESDRNPRHECVGRTADGSEPDPDLCDGI